MLEVKIGLIHENESTRALTCGVEEATKGAGVVDEELGGEKHRIDFSIRSLC